MKLILLICVLACFQSTLAVVVDDEFYDQLDAVLRNDYKRTTAKKHAEANIAASSRMQQPDEFLLSGGPMVRAGTEIVIVLYPDLFPQDLGFILSSSSVGGGVVAQQPMGFLITDGDATNNGEVPIVFTETVQVVEGEVYNLTVLDGFSDGLEAPGFFAVYYGSSIAGNEADQIFEQIGFEGRKATRLFTVKRPNTKAPSVSSQPSISPAPTHSPTKCLSAEDNGFQIMDQERDFNPIFRTDETVYGVDHCKPHDTYADCTNEAQQDCQWQFMGTSTRRGVCRVDPITACIASGNCVCLTSDFNGGSDDMANGLLFHAPISVTAHDIGPYQLKHQEMYTTPKGKDDDPAHPQSDAFFISRVDFTNRKVAYEFDEAGKSDVFEQLLDDFSLAFKLHYLYWDTPMVGNIWSGVGSTVGIDTTADAIIVNGLSYTLPSPLKRWTCTSIVMTSTTLYVGRLIIPRDLKRETKPPPSPDTKISLGPFTGELFDVRVYSGVLSWTEIREYGARCTSPDDPAALEYKRDIENPYYIYGCEPDFGRLPADEGGPVPTGTEGHTYGSGPFATLWLKPLVNPYNQSEYNDVSEGEFDEEHYFQQAKIQAYLWEKFLFHIDMIAFNQAPYRDFISEDQVPQHSATFWRNPCRHLHNFNNGWQYPIYGNALPKWTAKEHGDDVSEVFDLGTLYRNRAEWAGITFVAHEMFHGVQGHLGDLYAGAPSRWMAEATAEFGADAVFPAARKILAPLVLAPGYPMGLAEKRDKDRGQHFLSQELSINEWVRGGHLYGGWVLWWFLAEHAGLLHLVGDAYSNWFQKSSYTAGEIYYVRELVENANLDFGDVWATCVAHMRTWDFIEFGPLYAIAEQEDFEKLMTNPDVEPPIDPNTTLEGRKTAVEVDPVDGTNGVLVAGPSELRPGPNGWNCLTVRGVASDQYVSIKVEWDDGMGFQPDFEPAFLPAQQATCDQDVRFYNSVVVLHNEDTGERRYWKLKGKAPPMLHIETGSGGPVTIHVLLVPTPPADYVTGMAKRVDGSDGRVEPVPMYSYAYSVGIASEAPNVEFAPQEALQDGIMKFEPAKPGWWRTECTCLEQPDLVGNRCVRPIFEGAQQLFVDLPSQPSLAPTSTPDFDFEIAEGPLPQPAPSFCFAGESLVHVKIKGSTRMKDLKLGDEVLVEGNIFSKVYSFGHRHETMTSEYLRIISDQSSHPLEISPDHMVFLSGGRAVPASTLRVGDQFETSSVTGQRQTLVSIETVVREGAYAPFTYSGTILVDGFKASSYVSFQGSPFLKLGTFTTPLSYQWMAHASQLPHRLYCSYISSCTTEKYNDAGISSWVEYSHSMGHWLLKQNPLFLALLLIPVVAVLALFSLIGSIVVY
jgi:hypothetical protein